jgi:hypothetical protein
MCNNQATLKILPFLRFPPAIITMPKPNILDLADETPFNKDDWIGKGRIYNTKDVPWQLDSYLHELVEIPISFSKCAFPDDNMVVENFIRLKLLKPSFDLIHRQAKECFTQ